MTKPLKTIAILLIVIIAGIWVWKKWDAWREPLKYQDLAVKDPYEALARNTGGQVLKFEKGNMNAASEVILDVDSERDFTTLWTAEGQPAEESAEFKLAVDSSITDLSIFVSAISDRPSVTALNPSGVSINPNKTLNSKNAVKLNFTSPSVGVWRLKIQAQSNVHIKVKAKSTAQIINLEFVRPAGRPGHEGYFPYKGELGKGNKEILSINMLGVDDLKDMRVSTVSLSGRVLKTANADTTSNDLYVKIDIPNESFRILVDGKRKGNESFQRMHETIFNLNRKEMVEFKTQREESKESLNCKTLSESTHWSMLSGGKEPGSAVVMCVEHREANGSRWQSELNFHIPVNTDRTQLKTQLFSADYRKLTNDDCTKAKDILAQYPNELHSSSGHKLSWSFSCLGGPTDFQGVMEIKTF